MNSPSTTPITAKMTPIPDWPEEHDPLYRRIDQFYEPWACASFRLMENSFDNAHIHFVHRNTFGDGAWQVVQFCFRNDSEADAPAADIIAA